MACKAEDELALLTNTIGITILEDKDDDISTGMGASVSFADAPPRPSGCVGVPAEISVPRAAEPEDSVACRFAMLASKCSAEEVLFRVFKVSPLSEAQVLSTV